MLSLLLSTAMAATATTKVASYINDKGVKITIEQALNKSIAGETIYKCQEVKAETSKSGTSISLKVVK